MQISPWTASLMEELARVWREGWPTRAIGQRLTQLSGNVFSRNSCVGKAHRMGLPGRPSPIKRRHPITHRSSLDMLHYHSTRPSKTHTKSPRVIADKPQKPAESLGWRTSADHTCQYPLWDNQEKATQEFCPEKAVMRPVRRVVGDCAVLKHEPTSWCEKHFASCHVKTRPA